MSEDLSPVLEARHLRKVYPPRGTSESRVAVDDSSFTIARGESLGIVGESGSGKTTVAKMLVGLERPTAGEVLIDGAPVGSSERREHRKRRARRVQLVFQDPYSSLDPRQTIGAALEEVLRLHFDLSRDERDARVADLLDSVGLDERSASARPKQLSGGQRQRAAIARALATEPAVLVLDEAVAALDISIQAQILNLLTSLRSRTQTAFVFISHDLPVVAHITDRVQVMRNGIVVEEGPAETVLSQPSHWYTAALLDSVPGEGWTPQHLMTAANPE